MNFSLFEMGKLRNLYQYRYEHPHAAQPIPGKLFLGDRLGLTGCEISVNRLLPGQGTPFLHHHRQNEEIYLFLAGQGQFMVDDEVLPVREGTCIRVAPPALRAWRNTGKIDLVYLVIQAPDGASQTRTVEDGVRVPTPVTWPMEQTRSLR